VLVEREVDILVLDVRIVGWTVRRFDGRCQDFVGVLVNNERRVTGHNGVVLSALEVDCVEVNYYCPSHSEALQS